MRCDSAAARLSYYIPHIRRIVSVALESIRRLQGALIPICGVGVLKAVESAIAAWE